VTKPIRPAQAQIDQLVAKTGASDPRDAVRRKARDLIALYCAQFGDPSIPIDLDILASMLGITRSSDIPLYSPDAELAADEGRLTMRVNPDRPETRQRFSIGHEISHTFFPGYQLKVQCRPDSRYRDRDDPDDAIETLCDIGASELLFPLPWFTEHARNVNSAADLLSLVNKYRGSREATVRRFAETSEAAVAAVFLSWKLKPTQAAAINPDQTNLFGVSAAEEAWEGRQLRIDYAIPSDAFATKGLYLPNDKSVGNDGPMYEAAATGVPSDGECRINLGQAAGVYRVMAIPVWTPDEMRGAAGENAVAAIIMPVQVRKPKRKNDADGPGLFG
jgi:hypothetical protein